MGWKNLTILRLSCVVRKTSVFPLSEDHLHVG